VYPVPEEIDREIARLKLKSMSGASTSDAKAGKVSRLLEEGT